jgi:DNA-directed RNA polymerase specialized sigma subunit
MYSIIRTINAYFKIATRADVNDLLSKIILSERQQRIFEMFYIKRQNIGFIADTLGFSERVISEELDLIRRKISAVIQQ